MKPIKILYEDDHLWAVDKPAGLLTHPLVGKAEPSVVDWIVNQNSEIKTLDWPDKNRPGIVHRLDRDTSGVLLVAKTPEVLSQLQHQFASRAVKKTYLALVSGQPDWQETVVNAAVSRGEGTKRQARFLTLPDETSKPSETHFKVLKCFQKSETIRQLANQKSDDFCLVEAKPLTGRTHQIRVHLNLLGHPILGDPWYQTKTSRALTKALNIPRLMLHAAAIRLIHPVTQQPLEITAPLPENYNFLFLSYPQDRILTRVGK